MARASVSETLRDLKAELTSSAKAAKEELSKPGVDYADVERHFAAVGDALAEATHKAESGVKHYPLAAVAAAFALGAIVGRLSGRF